MTRSKSEIPAPLGEDIDGAPYEVIHPPKKLTKAIVPHRPGTPDIDPVRQAEEALAKISHEFADWMRHERERLETARKDFRADPSSSELKLALYHVAHDIRGQAETFGFPLVAPVADSLCRLLEYTPDPLRIPATLIDQHVDAVRAIIHEAQGRDNATALRLGGELRAVANAFLAAENHDRPDVLEIILGPPLAPIG